jgi:hypothetical protein
MARAIQAGSIEMPEKRHQKMLLVSLRRNGRLHMREYVC